MSQFSAMDKLHQQAFLSGIDAGIRFYAADAVELAGGDWYREEMRRILIMQVGLTILEADAVLRDFLQESGNSVPDVIPESPSKAVGYKDISAMSIDQIRGEIHGWVSNLKEGDEVFVMHSYIGWTAKSEYSYTATVSQVTECRVRITERDGIVSQFHRQGGMLVKGVSGAGEFRLIPPWLNPKDLEDAWMASKIISRQSTLDQIPTAKLLDILRQIQE